MVVMDLSEIQNRNIMLAVVNDIIPKFQNLVIQLEQEKLHKPKKVKKMALPKPQEPEPVLAPVKHVLKKPNL
jgi:hypothetical protein